MTAVQVFTFLRRRDSTRLGSANSSARLMAARALNHTASPAAADLRGKPQEESGKMETGNNEWKSRLVSKPTLGGLRASAVSFSVSDIRVLRSAFSVSHSPLTLPIRLLVGVSFCMAMTLTVPAQSPLSMIVDAIRLVESGGTNVPGDGGRAAGEWQLHAAACRDVGARHMEAWNHTRAREIATAYVTRLRSELARRLRRDPTAAEIYAAYNLGVRGFSRRGLRLDRCPPLTRARAAAVATLYEQHLLTTQDASLEARFAELVAAGKKLSIRHSAVETITVSRGGVAGCKGNSQ